MKQPTKITARHFFACLLLASALTIACDKDDDDPKTEFNLSASLDGAQEVPAVTTNGSGSLSGTYNANTNMLTYAVSWQQLTGPVTDMHFHGPANIGEPAGVAVAITGFNAAVQGNYSGSATLSDEQETQLLGGKWYINIHTDMHKPGEIRGQVSAQ